MHLVRRVKVTSLLSHFSLGSLDPLELTDKDATKLSGLVSFSYLVFTLREIKWELYNLDCKRAPDILRRHSESHKITGSFAFFLYLF